MKLFSITIISLDMIVMPVLPSTDCCEYCIKYKDLYKSIYDGPKGRWLTISPPYSGVDPCVLYEKWFLRISTFIKFCSLFICVAEFANDRLHFHLCYKLKDMTKKIIVLNNIRVGIKPNILNKGNQRVYGDSGESACQIRDYEGRPEKGLHYIFKDISDTFEVLENPIIVYRGERVKLEGKIQQASSFTEDAKRDSDELSSESHTHPRPRRMRTRIN